MSTSVAPAAAVANARASQGTSVKALFTFGPNQPEAITTTHGRYAVITQNPKVQQALQQIRESTTVGQKIVSVEGSVSTRDDGTKAFNVTSIQPAADVVSVGEINEVKGKFYGRVDGKIVELKPINAAMVPKLRQAANTRSSSVRGAMNGKRFEVWQTVVPPANTRNLRMPSP